MNRRSDHDPAVSSYRERLAEMAGLVGWLVDSDPDSGEDEEDTLPGPGFGDEEEEA